MKTNRLIVLFVLLACANVFADGNRFIYSNILLKH